jgi:hypothetical protein
MVGSLTQGWAVTGFFAAAGAAATDFFAGAAGAVLPAVCAASGSAAMAKARMGSESVVFIGGYYFT